jgi:hypothetical protein
LTEGVKLITKDHIHNLETELRIVLERLAPLLEEAKVARKAEPVDAEKIIKILDKLEPLLEDMDTDCLGLLEDLHSVPKAQALIDQIEGYQYDSALLTLENLRKELKAEHE